MERTGIHELTAAYALDALDPADEREYEEHLAACESCRRDLAGFQETAASLAYAASGPAPPTTLRARILEEARGERSNVVPLRRRGRIVVAASAATAVAAAAAAIVLGVWANSLSDSLDREQDRLALVGDPQARSVSLDGARGRLVVVPDGRAALVVSGLARAPEGKTYEVWVIEGETPEAAGLFDADDARSVVLLTERVRPGATVAVTLERRGGVDAPTTKPLFAARA